jgi:predicted phosphate transport protein (TIGR00153 family)
MSWFTNFFKPKGDTFLPQLVRQACLVEEGLEALMAFLKDPLSEHAEKVNRMEHEADEVRRVLIDDLNHTFVTPLDREDIFALSGAVDDLLDYATTTVDEMVVLKVAPDEYIRKMGQLLLGAAREIHLAMQRLEHHPNVANEHARRAKGVENRMESTYREALAELFSGTPDPETIVHMLKKREIYRHLSNAADRADEAANLINGIVVKMT